MSWHHTRMHEVIERWIEPTTLGNECQHPNWTSVATCEARVVVLEVMFCEEQTFYMTWQSLEALPTGEKVTYISFPARRLQLDKVE